MPDGRSYFKLTAAAVYLTCSLFGELVHQHQSATEVEQGHTCHCAHHHCPDDSDSDPEQHEDECRICQALAISVDIASPFDLPDRTELTADVEPIAVKEAEATQVVFISLRGPPTA